MSEKGPHSQLAQVLGRTHPTPLTFLSDLWKHIQTWHWARDILQGCIQAKEISTGHRMWPKPFAPSFFIPSFFTDQSNFRLSERGGRKGPDEGCWDGRKDRGPPHTHKLKNTDLQPYFYVYAQREDAGCKRCWRAGKEWACNRIPGPGAPFTLSTPPSLSRRFVGIRELWNRFWHLKLPGGSMAWWETAMRGRLLKPTGLHALSLWALSPERRTLVGLIKL